MESFFYQHPPFRGSDPDTPAFVLFAPLEFASEWLTLHLEAAPAVLHVPAV